VKLIRAGTVLTGRPGESIAGGAVLVDGDRIVAVGPRDAVRPPEGAPVEEIDLPGCTLLPGLVDAHVHLGFDDAVDPVTRRSAEPDARLVLRMAENARRLVSAGVTTARDLGGRNFLDVALRDAIGAGLTVGSRLLVATRPITTTGGHCWYLGGEADDDGAIRRVVRENLAAGADCLKVMASGGQMTPGGASAWESQYSADQLRIVVEEAAAAGKGVAAHAHASDSIRAALDAGVTTIEHCSFLTADGAVYDPALVDRLAAADVFVCPTMHGRFWALREAVGAAPMDEWLAQIGRMRDAGVRLVAGTDCGFHLGELDKRADDYVAALEVFAAGGFSPAQILELATVTAARACGVGADTGSLDAGKRADLIAVAGDPLTTVADLRNLELVLVAGRAVTQTGVESVGSSSGAWRSSILDRA
jgi:imidazolonepropionase-like amidohydrolase